MVMLIKAENFENGFTNHNRLTQFVNVEDAMLYIHEFFIFRNTSLSNS